MIAALKLFFSTPRIPDAIFIRLCNHLPAYPSAARVDLVAHTGQERSPGCAGQELTSPLRSSRHNQQWEDYFDLFVIAYRKSAIACVLIEGKADANGSRGKIT